MDERDLNFIKRYYDFGSRTAPYVVVLMVLVSLPIIIYSYFNLFKFHTEEITVFCNSQQGKRIGVTHEKFVDKLELFYNDSSEFESLPNGSKKYFYDNVIYLDTCQNGFMFSDKVMSARKLKFINEYTDRSETVYVLESFIDSENK